MGVRRLKLYLEQHCPSACYRVNISELVSNHRNRTGNRPEIVVDAHTCFSMWYEGLEWKKGMQVQQLIERLRSFVTNFQNIGADLVFFFRGLMEKRRSTWLGRQRSNLLKMMSTFKALTEGRTYISVDSDYVPPNMTNFVAYVLKYVLNCKVFVSADECDEDIIQYVSENGSLAIFSLDTDFVVAHVDCYMLSVCDFNASQMTTTLYDRKELCKYLKIKENQLPLFAIIVGNDYTSSICSTSLEEFHHKECNMRNTYRAIPVKRLFTALARYTSAVAGAPLNELMDTVCWDVFEDYSEQDEIMRAYLSYFPKSRLSLDFQPSTDAWSQVLSIAEVRLRNVLLPVSAWGVLTKRIYEGYPYLENMEVIHDGNEYPREQPSATITRPLRRRFYGILFYEIEESKPIVTEWCAEHATSYWTPVSVLPEYIQAFHPGLRCLWEENLSETLVQHKWILFLKTISSNKPIQNFGAWMRLPSDLVVSTAACYYLYMEKDFIDESELLTVLATLTMYQCNSLDTMYDGSCDLRAVKITMTFDDTFHLVFSILASCGYPEPLTKETAFMRFEPKLFQHLYKKVKSEPGYPILYGHGDCIERFNQMYDTIHGWDVPA